MIRSAIKRGIKKVIDRVAEPGEPAQRPAAPVARSTVEAAPVQAVPAQAAPVQATPVQAAPVQAAPVQAAPPPVEAAPVEVAPAVEAPAAQAPTLDANADTAGPALLSMDKVQEVLDEMVRPALQGDGGDITLVRIEANNIYVRLVGSCKSCPSSVATMRMGVEALLKEEFPAMNELIQVD